MVKSILDTFRKVADSEGITITSLEARIGASKGVLSRAMANSTDIQCKWFLKLVENYPQYEVAWLLADEKEKVTSKEIGREKDSDTQKYIAALEDHIATLKKNVERLEKEIL
eukprot:gene6744-9108_t